MGKGDGVSTIGGLGLAGGWARFVLGVVVGWQEQREQ